MVQNLFYWLELFKTTFFTSIFIFKTSVTWLLGKSILALFYSPIVHSRSIFNVRCLEHLKRYKKMVWTWKQQSNVASSYRTAKTHRLFCRMDSASLVTGLWFMGFTFNKKGYILVKRKKRKSNSWWLFRENK